MTMTPEHNNTTSTIHDCVGSLSFMTNEPKCTWGISSRFPKIPKIYFRVNFRIKGLSDDGNFSRLLLFHLGWFSLVSNLCKGTRKLCHAVNSG